MTLNRRIERIEAAMRRSTRSGDPRVAITPLEAIMAAIPYASADESTWLLVRDSVSARLTVEGRAFLRAALDLALSTDSLIPPGDEQDEVQR